MLIFLGRVASYSPGPGGMTLFLNYSSELEGFLKFELTFDICDVRITDDSELLKKLASL